jgi:hypothetical protein
MNPNTETKNVPEAIHQEAKAKALAVIEANKGCALCFRVEDLDTAALFIPRVIAIKPIKEDFHEYIPEMGILPKVPLQSTFLREAGINVTRTETRKEGKYLFVAHAFGEKLAADGTMQQADATYEFDCEARAERDFLKDSQKDKNKQKYATDLEKKKHLNDLLIKARAIAETGAHWRLTRRMASIPASFKTAEELMRGLLVIRIERNVNGVLAMPGMQQAAINHMLGATETVFGPKQITRTVDEQTGEMLDQPAAAAEEGQGGLFPESAEEKELERKPELTPEEKLKILLKEQMEKIPSDLVIKQGNVRELIQKTLDKKDATAIEINAWLDRCQQYFQNVQARNGGAS